jgi:hypothetical protein
MMAPRPWSEGVHRTRMVERSAVMDGSSTLPTYKGMCELRVVELGKTSRLRVVMAILRFWD